MQTFQDIAQNILSVSSDAVVILVLISLGTAIGFFYGKSRIIAAIISFYPAIILYDAIPLRSITEPNPTNIPDAVTSIAVFAVGYSVCFVALKKIVSAEFPFSRIKKTFEAVLFGSIFASLIVYMSYQVINVQKIYNFSGGIDSLFRSSIAFWWLIIPLVLVWMFRR